MANDYVIHSDMTVKDILNVIKTIRDNIGLTGGLSQMEKVKEGWLIAVVYHKDGFLQHWNYHPGRTTLVKAYETERKDSIVALDETMASLRQLYADDTKLVPIKREIKLLKEKK